MSELSDRFRLDERVAVVTGGASGIGRAVAEVFASAGAAVVVGDLDAEGAESTAAGIVERGGRALAQRVDVSQRAEVEALVDRAVADLGGLDVLANIAGIPLDVRLEEIGDEDFGRILGVNLYGTLYGCQAAIPAMAARGGGSIINVSSGAIDAPLPVYGPYAITKAGVAQLTASLATEVGDRGIRVNAIAPGATITAFTQRRLKRADGAIDSEAYDGFVDSMRAMSPLGRVGEAEDQAWLALYLASDASRFCTGQLWRANGGATFGR